jgi:dTDP-4-amino-4,6-dideoxygalactose transaminase
LSVKVPFVDLRAQYESIRPEIDSAIDRVLASGDFIGGEDCEAFESEFAAYCEARACVGVGNGTDAIHLALRAAGIGPGDEVITVANTFIATAEAITMTGARPVFVDVCAETHQIDPDAVESAVGPRTRAVVAVHLFGIPAPIDDLMEIAHRRDLLVLEDAAQAHGARLKGKRVGSLGHVACFSFYPSKNLGAYGDAGAVVGNDAELVERVRKLRNHGRTEKYVHEIEGVNSRLDNLQAAVLRVKLRHLDDWNAARRRVASQYAELLAGLPVTAPNPDPESEPVWHLFVVRTQRRGDLQDELRSRGVATGVHYPIPLHLQPAYRDAGLRRGPLPVTENLAAEILSLPMFPEMTPQMVQHVADSIAAAGG